MEEKRIKFYQFLIGTGDYTKDFGSFETQFFKDEVSVKKIWSFVLQKLYYTKSFKNFMSQYACDMTWAGALPYCSGQEGNNTTSIDGGNDTNKSKNTNKTTNNNVTISASEIENGGKLVKQGMSGDIVKKIQELLIKHGFTNISKSGKVDGIFGSRTAQAVYDFQQKNEIATDRVVGKETWSKLIQEPTTTKVVPPKLDPKTGLPDNSFGLPKFDTSIDRFSNLGVSKEKQAADLKQLKIQENMKLTDIINGMVLEQGTLTPNQRLAMTKGFGPVSAEYADKLVKDGTLKNSGNGQTPGGMTMPTTTVTANKQKSTSLPKGVPSMPSLKDVLNPTKSNLGPVSGKSTAAVGKPTGKLPSGVPSMPTLKDIVNPTKSNLGPVGNKQTGTAQTAAPATGTAQTAAPAAAPAVKPQQPYSLTDVAKGGYLRAGMKGNVVRDMQVLINSLNNPDIKVDQSGVFNQDTLNAVIKLQKMLGVKPKNGKYGIFGPVTIAAINKNKAGANDKTKIDPKTGLPYDTVGAMRDKLPDADTTTNSGTPSPKFSTDASRFSKYGVSKAQQDADLKKLGINEDLIKKIVEKHLHSL